MTVISFVKRAGRGVAASTSVFLRDVGHGLLEVSHNTLAVVGLIVVAAVLFTGGHAELRHSFEEHAFGWLKSRQEARSLRDGNVLSTMVEPGAVARATAADPKDLSRQQSAVALWLSRRYKVAPEPISRLVKEAWTVGERAGLDPTLILAIMAIESSFNPFAQSSVGAQGLMQVMTQVHDDKYVAFGGNHAAFDPVTNLRVGVQVLKDCIARAGGLEAGLRYYVGAANLANDGGYAGKVLGEQLNLKQVAGGRALATNIPLVPVVLAPLVTRDATTPTTPQAEPQPAAVVAPEAEAATTDREHLAWLR